MPVKIEISEQPLSALDEYAGISIAFEAASVLDVAASSGGFILSERRLDTLFHKDYDALDGEGPRRWRKQFDLPNWALFLAHIDGRAVGGAAVIFDTEGIDMLEARSDLAVLWDIRVAPEARGQHVGSMLFQAVEVWAHERGCRQLKIETQNTNVAACRFYERQGCSLEAINRSAYRDFPDEIQLLWYKDLFF